MKLDVILIRLRQAGYEVEGVVRMGDDDGDRITLPDRTVIHSFDDGRRVVHGPSETQLQRILNLAPACVVAASAPPPGLG
jgi:hypothetical protein